MRLYFETGKIWLWKFAACQGVFQGVWIKYRVNGNEAAINLYMIRHRTSWTLEPEDGLSERITIREGELSKDLFGLELWRSCHVQRDGLGWGCADTDRWGVTQGMSVVVGENKERRHRIKADDDFHGIKLQCAFKCDFSPYIATPPRTGKHTSM